MGTKKCTHEDGGGAVRDLGVLVALWTFSLSIFFPKRWSQKRHEERFSGLLLVVREVLASRI